jgi:hypothetical protein
MMFGKLMNRKKRGNTGTAPLAPRARGARGGGHRVGDV